MDKGNAIANIKIGYKDCLQNSSGKRKRLVWLFIIKGDKKIYGKRLLLTNKDVKVCKENNIHKGFNVSAVSKES